MAGRSDLSSSSSPNTVSTKSPSTQSSSISALRTLAQSHLIEIEAEKADEARDQEWRMKHLQRYVKISRKEREKNERVKAQFSSSSPSSGSRSASNNVNAKTNSRVPASIATTSMIDNNKNEDNESRDGESGGGASLSLIASNASVAETAEEAVKWSPGSGSLATSTLTSTSAPKSTPLRPVQDILSRLRWDTNLSLLQPPSNNNNNTTTTTTSHNSTDTNTNTVPSLSDYKIGYIERFTGIQEIPVSNWITESTDEDFIPLHRIRYIKLVRNTEEAEEGNEKQEVVVVWDRDERVDLVFGSGRTAAALATA